MNLNEDFGVSPGKVDDLRGRIARLAIDVAKIDEQFVKGGGPGGQKTNKTSNGVLLRYGDLVIRCRRDRRRTVNRFLALRELVDRIEMAESPATSTRLAKETRARASARRSKRRARARHRAGNGITAPSPEEHSDG